MPLHVIVNGSPTPWWQIAITALGGGVVGGILAIVGSAWDRDQTRRHRREEDRQRYQRESAQDLMAALAAIADARARFEASAWGLRRAKIEIYVPEGRQRYLDDYNTATLGVVGLLLPTEIRGYGISDEGLRNDLKALLVRLGQRVSEEQKKTAAAGEPTAPGTELLSDEDLGNLDEQLNAELVSVAERLAAIARG